MSDASTSAAPADAGPTNDQGAQPDGNSAVDREDTTRQDRGAAPSNPQAKPKQQAKPKTEPSDDDPEWDFGDGRKAKRSEIRKRMSEIQNGAQNAWKKHQESEKRLTERNERLKSLGVDPEAFEKDPEGSFAAAAERFLAKKLEEASLEPTERERRELKAENERLQKAEKERVEQEQRTLHQQQVQERAEGIAQRFSTALKESDLPQDGLTLAVMVDLAKGAARAKQDISLSELASRTGERLAKIVDHYLPEEDGAAIARRLGPKRVEALLKHARAEHEAKFQKFEAPQSQPQQLRRQPSTAKLGSHPNGYYSLDEWNRSQARQRRQ